MSKKLFFVSLLLVFCFCTSFGQTVQLLLEDFNGGNNTFTLNEGGPASSTGINRWVVNKQYNGGGIHLNTTSEHNTVSGNITRPDSNYLHIFDSTSANANCSYNNIMAGDNFAYTTGGFCTLGLTNIHFTFFYIAEGTTADYGEVYYSINDSAWVPCGQLKYNSQTLWKYEDVSLPAFANHRNVRFGFRWVNSGAGGAAKMAFGVDDVIAAGDVNTANTVTINISATNDTLCSGQEVIFTYSISQPLCDGNYQLLMSNNSNFSGATNLGISQVYAGQTHGIIYAYLPKFKGNCYKLRFDRISQPAITGTPSSCVNIVNCPVTITTLRPEALHYTDTICGNSIMDVPFYSTGVFNSSNKYNVYLSDENGSYTNQRLVGSITDNNAYDPANYSAGIIQVSLAQSPYTITPGCQYRIKVVSTSPVPSSSGIVDYGPFCIVNCAAAPGYTDIAVCVSDSFGADKDVTIGFNAANYYPDNKFEAQLAYLYPNNVYNTGGLGIDSVMSNHTLHLHIPRIDSLENILNIYPNIYLLRLLATHPINPADSVSSTIRLTIGYADPKKPVLVSYNQSFITDSVFCPGEEMIVDLYNYDYNANYQWRTLFNLTGYPQPFYFHPPMGLSLDPGTQAKRYWFITRENDFGCFSPWSDTLWVNVIKKPVITSVSVSPITCYTDTVTFTTPFQDDTYYSWTPTANIIDTANNLVKMLFPTKGNYTVTVSAVNQCGNRSSDTTIIIGPPPVIAPISVTPITCNTDTVTFTTSLQKDVTYSWTPTANIIITDSNLAVMLFKTDGNYTVTVKAQNQCGSASMDTAIVIFPRGPFPRPVLITKVNGTPDSVVYFFDNLNINITNYNPSAQYDWDTNYQPSHPNTAMTITGANAYIYDIDQHGRVWFVVREITPGGCDTITSDTVWVNFEWPTNESALNTAGQIHIYPNPATDVVQVQLPAGTGNYILQLTDVTGEVLKEKNISQTTQLPLDDIAPGVYFIRLRGKVTQTFKLVRE